MVGLLNSDACLRTASFDAEGILQGDVRFTVLDYSSTSAPNRFRYLSSNLSRVDQAKLMECITSESTDAKGKNGQEQNPLSWSTYRELPHRS
jgi:hypothetical protein